jgi:hypothetical protein
MSWPVREAALFDDVEGDAEVVEVPLAVRFDGDIN